MQHLSFPECSRPDQWEIKWDREEGIGGFPGRPEFSHMRSSSAISAAPIYTLRFQHSGCHNRLNCAVPKQLELAAAVRVPGVNTNSHAEVVSTGQQWAYETVAVQDSTARLGFSILVLTVVNEVQQHLQSRESMVLVEQQQQRDRVPTCPIIHLPAAEAGNQISGEGEQI